MNLLKPHSIEEYIISLLQNKSFSGTELLVLIRISRPKTTKQALYAALRKLKSSEIVVMHNMRISLSSIWVLKMTEFFQLAKHFYTKNSVIEEGFLNLEDGDRISYSFKNPNLTDIFWGHAFDILSEITPTTMPIYIYNPHQWFIIARPETEKTLYKKITASGQKMYTLAGSATPIDIAIKKEFDGTLAQYHTVDGTAFEKRNYYFNIFGDFIIEAWLNESSAKKLDAVYENTQILDEAAIKRIKAVISETGEVKLTISRNAKKSTKLRKIFKQYFF